MKGRELPSMTYRNCLRDSGEVHCGAMKVRGWDFQSAGRLRRHTGGSSLHGARGAELSLYSSSAITRRRIVLAEGAYSEFVCCSDPRFVLGRWLCVPLSDRTRLLSGCEPSVTS